MSKVLIVAPDKTVAGHIAKSHMLLPWQWRFIFTPEKLHGATEKDVIFIHNDSLQALSSEMAHEISVCRSIGVDIVVVTT